MFKEIREWVLTAFIIVAVLAVINLSGDSTVEADQTGPDWWTGENGTCGKELTRTDLDASLVLGRSFLLNNQRELGNFEYQYDWRQKAYDPADNQVRQAGATWGISLLYRDQPDAELRSAVLRSLDFWKTQSHVTQDGRRFVSYLDERGGQLGTVALVALAHIETLRTDDEALTNSRRTELAEHLAGYLQFLVDARHPDGRFRDRFRIEDGTSIGNSSPYSDGEALLALVKAAKYLHRDDLKPLIYEIAKAGIVLNVDEALSVHPDSDTTKGYYQWASMSWAEMVTADWEDTTLFGDTTLRLADWMIDVHKTLRRSRNTAYAYEGIISAYVIAERRGDQDHIDKYRCVMNRGLRKLTTWQVGHPLANKYVMQAGKDPKSEGGVQNHHQEAPLRIDVTQHQMHAVILARAHVFTP
jgi:hypothetical protein